MDTKDAPQIVNHSTVSVTYVPHACRWVPNSLCCFAAGEAANRSGEIEVYKLTEAQLKRKEHRQTKAGIKCLSLTRAANINHSLVLSGQPPAAAAAAAAGLAALGTQNNKSSNSSLWLGQQHKVKHVGAAVAAWRETATAADAGAGVVAAARKAAIEAAAAAAREALAARGAAGERTAAENFLSHFDGRLMAWDAEVLEREAWSLKAHESVLTTVDAHPTQPLVITGGREGVVKVWDLRTKQQVVSLEPVAGEEAAECWSVCWGGCTGGSLGSVCCGYDNGDVKLFDLGRMQLLAETNLDYGVCCLACDRRDIALNKLLVAALEGKLFTADLRTQHPEEGFAFKQHQISKGTIWGVYPLPQNREIAAASCGSGTVAVLLYSYPDQRSLADPETGLLRGVVGSQQMLNEAEVASQPVVDWSWHPQKAGLAVSAALDQQIRLTVVTKLSLF
ncbi:hypothetical protein Esti_001244 [Eimeria stiedai]